DRLLHLDDGALRGHRHDGVKVPRRAPEDQVAGRVCLVRADERVVGEQRGLEEVRAAAEVARLAALGEASADGGRGVERWDARAPGADALGEAALRDELRLDLAGADEALRRPDARR